MAKAFQDWAVPQLSRLLPLDNESLKQIVTYTDTLDRENAADHLKNLLGDSPQAFEYISAFNHRRPKPPNESDPSPAVAPQSNLSEVPKTARRAPKKKGNIHTLPARQVEPLDAGSGGYMKKKDGDSYITSASSKPSKSRAQPSVSSTLALQPTPDAVQLPTPQAGLTPSTTTHSKHFKLPPSAAGSLISDPPSKSSSSSRAASPAPAKTKVNISGGASMRGQSTTLNDLDSAIRALELQTNPSLLSDSAARRACPCMATRHALLAAAPNCLACGKIICAKEGIGPCTFCATPLLTPAELQAMVRILKDERGTARQAANNAPHRRADVAKTATPFHPSNPPLTTPGAPPPDLDAADAARLAAAKAHRDRLLKFQADNARRTRIHDEAADFETPDAGLSQWASPAERALQLKRQQQVLREQEWSARPEWEKRRMVASIDLVGGKAVRRMVEVGREEAPAVPEPEPEREGAEAATEPARPGPLSRNPLLGGLVRPVWRGEEGDVGAGTGKGKEKERRRDADTGWRRVQDDRDVSQNETWILDGGAYGDAVDARVLGAEEHGESG